MTNMKRGGRQRTWIVIGVGACGVTLPLALDAVTDISTLSRLDLAIVAICLFLLIGLAIFIGLFLIEPANERANGMPPGQYSSANRRAIGSRLSELNGGVERQFRSWGMTDAEREVGRLMLNGLSNREIADLRATSETMVSLEAMSICHKAGVADKEAFLTYFLGRNNIDLLSGKGPTPL